MCISGDNARNTSNPMRPPGQSSTRDSRTVIRPARPDEAGQLTAMAIRSKAYWGYDSTFMQACVPALTISPERIATEQFFVLEEDGWILAFAGLRTMGADAELADLFVEAIGRGFGKQLWQHVIHAARSKGATRVRIEADPFAEGFYIAMGAERIDETPSDAIPGRTLPLLMFEVPQGVVKN